MTMYLEHFGLREAPFRITPHTEFFFAGANRGATLEALLYAITAGEGMVKVTGEVGSGKTMLCRVLMERLPESVETIYLAVPSLSRDEMLAAIASDLDIDTTGANTTRLVKSLQEKLVAIHASGRQVVALIDEAHAMPLATLEEIRLLSNLETNKEKLLQIVLFGQPELDQHLALPNMRQLKERITHSFVLGPLPPREVDEYIRFRLRAAGYRGPDLFGPEALRIITDASEGLTRRINIYADKTLLAAFAAGTHTVSPDHARAAVSDTQIVVNAPRPRRQLAAAGAVGLVAGIAVGFGLAQMMRPDVPPPAVAAAAPRVDSPPRVPVSPAAPPPAPTAQAAGIAPAGNVQPAPPAPPTPGPAGPPADLIDGRTAAGRELLAQGSTARYSVQLMATDPREREYLETYLAEAGHLVDPQKLYLVASGTPQSPRVGVLFGAFEARNQAADALGGLPAALRQFKPYVRSVDALREEVRRSQGQ
ncbi:MAG TPA: AAA family ATPase [Usitatibacter sp.]|nr:AAA family ATPase [Usitatibacter sp.]